jgi:hypothetical protein
VNADKMKTSRRRAVSIALLAALPLSCLLVLIAMADDKAQPAAEPGAPAAPPAAGGQEP